MKPVLVLALGNAFAGDDGVACEVAARLARSGCLADSADVHCAGTDLLRAAPLLRGRRRLVILDAALGDRPGVEVRAHARLHGAASSGAHALDPVAALELLRAVDDEIAAIDTIWVLITVAAVRLGKGLSPATEALIPAAITRCLELACAPLPTALPVES